MPYFVNIGAIQQNKSGVGARGYHIFRRGPRITTVWGAIEVRPGRKFYWAHTTQHRTIRCASERAAIRRLRVLIREREARYSKLPRGARIARTARSRNSTRKP